MIRKRLCRLLFKLKLYHAAAIISPSVFYALLSERVGEAMAAALSSYKEAKSND